MRKILFFIPLFLWTCGGGGGSSPTEPEPPQLPTVQNINLTATEDTPKVFTFVGTDPLNLALSYSVSTQPQNGTVVISGGSGTYTPNANYNGQDIFLYLASSVNGNSNIGTVVIDISPVDDEPNTMDVSVTTDEDNVATMTLEAEEVDGQTIQFNVTGNPSNGSVTISGTTATYTPNQDWFGTDTFNFEAVDVASKSILNNATGTITVNPINDAPTVDDINNVEVSNGQSVDITLTGSDVENDNLTFEIVDSPNNGTVSISGNIATFDATSVGSDTFTYKATDGTDESNVATVSINVLDTTRFTTTFGGSLRDKAYSGLQTSDGGYILAGYTQTGSSCDYVMYVVKTDTGGNEIWSQTYYREESDCDNNDIIRDIKQTSDGGYILAGSALIAGDQDAALVKIDAAGNEEWFKTFNGVYGNVEDDQAYSVLQTSDGGYIVVGREKSPGSIDNIYILKTDSSGNQEWAKNLEQNGQDSYGDEIVEASDGGYVVAGSIFNGTDSDAYIMKINSSGDVEWINTYGNSGNGDSESFESIKNTLDGGYIAGGRIEISWPGGDSQFYLVKTDVSGNQEWVKTYQSGDTSDQELIYHLNTTNDGGYITVGNTNKGYIYLLKVDASGNEVWSKSFGDGSDDYNAYHVEQTSDAGYIIMGDRYSGEYDMLLIKVDHNGDRIF